MEPNVTISLTMSLSKASGLLQWLSRQSVAPSIDLMQVQKGDSVPVEFKPHEATPEKDLAYLLKGKSQDLARFAVLKRGEFYNDELAAELGVEDPHTAFELGRVTRKLQRVGFPTEGFQGDNWYTKRRIDRRTAITVKPDALALLERALLMQGDESGQ